MTTGFASQRHAADEACYRAVASATAVRRPVHTAVRTRLTAVLCPAVTPKRRNVSSGRLRQRLSSAATARAALLPAPVPGSPDWNSARPRFFLFYVFFLGVFFFFLCFFFFFFFFCSPPLFSGGPLRRVVDFVAGLAACGLPSVPRAVLGRSWARELALARAHRAHTPPAGGDHTMARADIAFPAGVRQGAAVHERARGLRRAADTLGGGGRGRPARCPRGPGIVLRLLVSSRRSTRGLRSFSGRGRVTGVEVGDGRVPSDVRLPRGRPRSRSTSRARHGRARAARTLSPPALTDPPTWLRPSPPAASAGPRRRPRRRRRHSRCRPATGAAPSKAPGIRCRHVDAARHRYGGALPACIRAAAPRPQPGLA